MTLLYWLADLFIDTFGITHPTQQKRKEAAFFILGLLILVIAGVGAVFWVAHTAMK